METAISEERKKNAIKWIEDQGFNIKNVKFKVKNIVTLEDYQSLCKKYKGSYSHKGFCLFYRRAKGSLSQQLLDFYTIDPEVLKDLGAITPVKT